MAEKTAKERKWSDDLYILIYDLVREGNSLNATAGSVGVTTKTLRKWIRRKPALREAVERAGSGSGKKGLQTIRDYLYGRLPPKLQKVWDDIVDIDKQGYGLRKLERLLQNQGVKARQHLFLHALFSLSFDASKACHMVGISPKTYKAWMTHDPDFAELVEEVDWHKANFFDSALIRRVKKGDTAAVIYAHKSFKPVRRLGYESRTDGDGGNGTVNNTFNFVPIESLGLDFATKEKVLEALKQRQRALPAHEDVIDAEFTVKEKPE